MSIANGFAKFYEIVNNDKRVRRDFWILFSVHRSTHVSRPTLLVISDMI